MAPYKVANYFIALWLYIKTLTNSNSQTVIYYTHLPSLFTSLILFALLATT